MTSVSPHRLPDQNAIDTRGLPDEIAASWRRCLLSGLAPDGPTATIARPVPERDSRLLRAATAAVGDIEAEWARAPVAIVLADAAGQVVHRTAGDSALTAELDEAGVAPGRLLSEDTAGTNGVGTALELRTGITVAGPWHYLARFRRFSCCGSPIHHPVTRRLTGALSLWCPATENATLLTPLLSRTAVDIAHRLTEDSDTSERALLTRYRELVRREQGAVLALSEDFVLANAAAIELVESADHAVLHELASDTAGPRRHRVRLTRGELVDVDAINGTGGWLFRLRRVDRGGAIPQRRAPDHDTDLVRCRRQQVPVLIAGEPGTGRTTRARRLAGGEPVATVDPAKLHESAWHAELDRLERLHTGLLVIESIELLGLTQIARLDRLLDAESSWVALTSAPVAELSEPHRRLAARCLAHVELPPLRNRRDDLPSLVHDRLRALGVDHRLRFTPSALRALAGQPWPDNVRELHQVIDAVLRHRSAGDITRRDLPARYQNKSRHRTLRPIEQAEYDTIMDALRECGGNKVRAAERIGISRSTLHRRIRAFGIRV